jgi:hypothetical protein
VRKKEGKIKEMEKRENVGVVNGKVFFLNNFFCSSHKGLLFQ